MPDTSATISAVPGVRAVTLPPSSTMATAGSVVDQRTAASLSGQTRALSTMACPGSSCAAGRETCTPCTGVPTTTSHSAVRELPSTVAVMAVMPSARAVTVPSASTDATAGSSTAYRTWDRSPPGSMGLRLPVCPG